MSRKPNTEARCNILKAAYGLFFRSGFKGCSMDDIATASGVKKANLFHYYPTKEELAVAVFDQTADEKKAQLMEQLSERDEPTKIVARIFGDAAECMKKSRCCGGCYVGNIALELSDSSEKLRQKAADYLRFWTDRLADLLEGWKVKGYFKRTLDPAQAAASIVSLYEGSMLVSKASKDVGAIEKAGKMAVEYLESFRA